MSASLKYIRDHWRGKQSLGWSFWINLVLIRLLVFAIEIVLQGALDRTELPLVAAKTIFFIVFHIIVLGWQIVGTVRAAESHMQATGSSLLLWAIYASCLGSLIMTANVVLNTNKPVQSYDFIRTWADVQSDRRKAQYQLRLSKENQTLYFSGLFVIGVRQEFQELLTNGTQFDRVVFESPGGNIYEARGVARLLLTRRIATHIDTTCASACAIAYLSGHRRSIADNGRLGFHKYAFDLANKQPHPMINLADEHKADRRYMKGRGLSEVLLAKVFSQAHSDIWFPPTNQLLKAGAVHYVGTFGR